MRVVFMSGYAQHAITILGDLPEGCAFLQKPIPRETLLAKVREELRPSSSPEPRV
jgi:FixJ family two-component response regulator